jgi:hypothetical protein
MIRFYEVWNLDIVDEEVYAIHRLSKPVLQLALTDDDKNQALAATRAGLSLWNITDGKMLKYIPITQYGPANVRVSLLYFGSYNSDVMYTCSKVK